MEPKTPIPEKPVYKFVFTEIETSPGSVADVIDVAFKSPTQGTLSLFDLKGWEIKTFDVIGTKAEIDMRDLSSGTYLLCFEGKDGNSNVQKLIMKN